MVAEGSCYDLSMTSLKVQRSIPIIHISSYFTTFCYVTIRMTAVESPPAIFVIIAMVAFNSPKILISTTHEKNRLVKFIYIRCPRARLSAVLKNSPTIPSPQSIFSVVIMPTFNMVHTISTLTHAVQPSIPFIVVRS